MAPGESGGHAPVLNTSVLDDMPRLQAMYLLGELLKRYCAGWRLESAMVGQLAWEACEYLLGRYGSDGMWRMVDVFRACQGQEVRRLIAYAVYNHYPDDPEAHYEILRACSWENNPCVLDAIDAALSELTGQPRFASREDYFPHIARTTGSQMSNYWDAIVQGEDGWTWTSIPSDRRGLLTPSMKPGNK